MSDKKELGQYYTTTNPFTFKGFIEWLEFIPNLENEILLEPFAGANNIPYMLKDRLSKWSCFDICPEYKIITRDTLKNFPVGYNVVITNPPYLGKSAAKRKKIKYDYPYDDLYKYALKIMLDNSKYVAAIIPETFIISGEFRERLYSVISLSCRMFEDTSCPVCLAMFIPDKTNDFKIYRLNEFIGTYNSLMNHNVVCNSSINWEFNNPAGSIGICCIDNSITDSIYFCDGDLISSNKIKNSSRSYTRVSGLPEGIDKQEFIILCNEILSRYRLLTKDIFMASFKCLRRDGVYRRRLDFKTARNILNKAYSTIRAMP